MKPEQPKRPGMFLLRPETKLHAPHIEHRCPQTGVPFFIGFSERTEAMYEAICVHRDRWLYVPSAGTSVPPCLAHAMAHGKGDGCPTGLERDCFFAGARYAVGRAPAAAQEALTSVVENIPQADLEGPVQE